MSSKWLKVTNDVGETEYILKSAVFCVSNARPHCVVHFNFGKGCYSTTVKGRQADEIIKELGE